VLDRPLHLGCTSEALFGIGGCGKSQLHFAQGSSAKLGETAVQHVLGYHETVCKAG
jgi:hypothetical protein